MTGMTLVLALIAIGILWGTLAWLDRRFPP